MEAANLGAYLSPWPAEHRRSLNDLDAGAPSSPADRSTAGPPQHLRCDGAGPSIGPGQASAFRPGSTGHEPTNLFATRIAKYFANALREDTLLHRCRGGIVYLPGHAGHRARDLPSGDRELLCR